MSGKSRTCGAVCHNARKTPPAQCRCWCRGFYHGPAGQKAREELMQHFTEYESWAQPELGAMP